MIHRVSLAAGLLLAIASPAFTAEPASFQLRGKVLDAKSNVVAGATVVYYPRNPAGIPGQDASASEPVISGNDGSFKIDLKTGSGDLTVRKTGYPPLWRSYWNVRADQDHVFVFRDPAFLSGQVLDAADKPVANAEVLISLAMLIAEEGAGRRSYFMLSGQAINGLFSTRTSADGTFRMDNVPSGISADLDVKSPGKALRQPQREYISPETLMCAAGDKNVRLIMDPAGQLKGKVVFEGVTSPTLPVNPTLRLVRNGPTFRQPDPFPVAADGSFACEDVAPGDYVIQSAFGTNHPPDWVAESVVATVRPGTPAENHTVAAVKGGIAEVTVLSETDRKPISGVSLSFSKSNFGAMAQTDAAGLGKTRLPPGDYQVVAFHQNSQSEANLTVTAGQSEKLEIILKAPPTISGKVVTSDGKPVPGIPVRLFPNWFGPDQGRAVTDSEGRYTMQWQADRYAGSDRNFMLVAQDTNRNLAASADLEPDTKELNLQLDPALSITGKIQGPDGKALSDGRVTLYLWSGNSGSSLDEPTLAKPDGSFEIRGLPAGRRYSLSATATGYGSGNAQVEEGAEPGKVIEVEPFSLRVANLKLSGTVIDEEEKLVANAWINLYGPDQPNGAVRSDSEGRFTFDAVCEGTVNLSASARNAYGHTNAEGGDTNVVVQLGRQDRYVSAGPRRTGMLGQPLPDLTPFGIAKDALPEGKPALLCLVDTEQRPSRRCLRLLAEQQDQLKAREVSIIALQTAITSDDSWKEWSAENPLPYQVGRIAEKQPATTWATGVETLPWLILIDAQSKVAAEGFDLEELPAKLEALK